MENLSVDDNASLEHSMIERERTQDPDGRFRINNYFCHADSWQSVLPPLVENGDSVLMDLRNFSAANTGCIHELYYLLQKVPINRCLLVVDASTDKLFLEHTLQEAWDQLSSDSPNRIYSLEQLVLNHFDIGRAPLHWLVRQLCNTAAG